jgi:hypothetical protein
MRRKEAEQMKFLKYELLDFSGLAGALFLLLVLPGGDAERDAIKTVADGMASTEMFGER